MIGVVDITTIGSTIFQKKIAGLGGNNYKHIEFAVHSLPLSEYNKCLVKNDWNQFAELINISIKKLESIGAKMIVIPSNTPHYAFPLLKSSVKLLNLIEVVKDHCLQKKYKSILILGTQQTMYNGLYDKYFQDTNVNIIKPSNELGSQIHNLIFNQIIPEKINNDFVLSIKKAVDTF